jgi:predicted Zn-dependent protease
MASTSVSFSTLLLFSLRTRQPWRSNNSGLRAGPKKTLDFRSHPTEAYGGHLNKAREVTKRAVDSAIRADSKETGATWQAIAAQREAVYGNPAEARRDAALALRLAPTSQAVAVEASLAYALAEETSPAESMAQDLSKKFPLNTQIQSLWLPAIHAQVALDRKDPAAALNALQAASPLELGGILFTANTSCLYPAYVRGEAYLAAGQGKEAAAEFQKILDHNGLVWNCAITLIEVNECKTPDNNS